MAELVAVRCRPSEAGGALQRVWAEGAAALLLPPDAPEAAIAAILSAHRPARFLEVLTSGQVTVQATEAPLPIDDDVALVVTTSGSTGEPKGVELTHTALEASSQGSLARLGCRPGERWALTLPTHHIAGVQVLRRSWALGTDAVVVASLEELDEVDAQHVSLVPTQLRRSLDAGVDLARFATVLLGGAPADPGLLDRTRQAGVRLVGSYGMSETCGGCVYDGTPLPGVEVGLVDDRIRIRGPVLFSGYRGQGAPELDDGWFVTSDRGRWRDGCLEVLGRADDVVVTGGENVGVAAVEAQLRSAAGVAEVAVTGVPDAEWGELLVAVVVPTDRARPPTLAGLRDHVRTRQPPAFAPRRLVLVDHLPYGPMGELARGRLAALVDGQLP